MRVRFRRGSNAPWTAVAIASLHGVWCETGCGIPGRTAKKWRGGGDVGGWKARDARINPLDGDIRHPIARIFKDAVIFHTARISSAHLIWPPSNQT